jgi:hypothetical protein
VAPLAGRGNYLQCLWSVLEGPEPTAPYQLETRCPGRTRCIYLTNPSSRPNSRQKRVAGKRWGPSQVLHVRRRRPSNRGYLSRRRQVQRYRRPGRLQWLSRVQQPRLQDGSIRPRASKCCLWSRRIQQQRRRRWRKFCPGLRSRRYQRHSSLPELRDHHHAAVEEGRSWTHYLQCLWYVNPVLVVLPCG